MATLSRSPEPLAFHLTPEPIRRLRRLEDDGLTGSLNQHLSYQYQNPVSIYMTGGVFWPSLPINEKEDQNPWSRRFSLTWWRKNITHLGCTVPPNADSYWVGPAGPGPSYIEAGGDRHLYTNRTIRYLVKNTTYMARLLKDNPIPTNLKELDGVAVAESD